MALWTADSIAVTADSITATADGWWDDGGTAVVVEGGSAATVAVSADGDGVKLAAGGAAVVVGVTVTGGTTPTSRDVLVMATAYSHPQGATGERRWLLYAAGEAVALREWGWGAPTEGLAISGVPVGSYDVAVQDRTALVTGTASERYAFEVVAP
jgi:hypothetical protein